MCYNQSQSAISEIVNWIVIYIDEWWNHLLDFDHTHLLSSVNLEIYADAIHHAAALCISEMQSRRAAILMPVVLVISRVMAVPAQDSGS